MSKQRIDYLNASLLLMIQKARELREENEKIRVQLEKSRKALKKLKEKNR